MQNGCSFQYKLTFDLKIVSCTEECSNCCCVHAGSLEEAVSVFQLRWGTLQQLRNLPKCACLI